MLERILLSLALSLLTRWLDKQDSDSAVLLGKRKSLLIQRPKQ